jgi:hypothetical protein
LGEATARHERIISVETLENHRIPTFAKRSELAKFCGVELVGSGTSGAGKPVPGTGSPQPDRKGFDAEKYAAGLEVPSRHVLELADASSGDMRLSDHAARSMI